ncbi:MAG: sulfatase-like hydrolase/transferase, partial [Kocuria sp.]|nr:sulfatase-like hydrolase/transferase [Kocuria sp.]
YDALGAAGNPHIRTPHLDRLAAQGTRFSNCYTQSSVCAPSRGSLMTGRYPRHHGLWANGVDMDPGSELFTRVLADEGYDCGLAGKFHLGSAFNGRIEPRLDDGFRIFRWAHDPYVRSPANEYHNWLRRTHPDLYRDAVVDRQRSIDALPQEAHYSRWIAEETIEFLAHTRDRDKPFCFIANFFDPHHGFETPERFRAMYDPQSLPRPVTVEDELETKPPIYRQESAKSYAGHMPGFDDHTPEQLQESIAQYYAMVSLVDEDVGRILQVLDTEGLAEDTVVVFTSDHGEMLGDHRMLLKGPMMFDCSVKVPLIVRRPGHVPAGQVREELVEWIDLTSTLLAAAGSRGLSRAQGRDLGPLWRGEDWEDRDWVLSEYRDGCWAYDPPVLTTMVRRGDRKIVVHHGRPATDRDRTGELYDLGADPRELHNLWDVPEHREQRAEMLGFLVDVLAATEDRSRERLAPF